MSSINLRSLGIGVLFGFMFAMPLVVVAFARNDSREHQALLNNMLSWTVNDLSSRLGDADFRLGRAIENPQDARLISDAYQSVSGAAGVLQNLMSGVPLNPEYGPRWYDMSRGLFRASSELERMRTEIINNGTLSEQSIARLQEMRDIVTTIRDPLLTSEVLGEQGVRFDQTAVNRAAQAASAF